MKLAAMGDLHLRSSIPRGRTDQYDEVLMNKFKGILDTCDEHKIKILIQPGDFFDSVSVPIDLLIKTINLLKTHKVHVYVVYGQHDLRFHSKDTSNTPLRLLETLGLVTRLLPAIPVLVDKVALWGSSWGEEITKLKLSSLYTNILAIHKMITNDKLWPGAKDYIIATDLLKETGFDLVVAGDNHKAFAAKYGEQFLVNCGSLGRANIDQIDHQPNFVIFDTKTKKLSRITVPVELGVLKVEEAENLKQKEAELAKYIEGMKSVSLKKKMKYKEIVLNALKENKADELLPMMTKIFQMAEGEK